VNHYDAIKAEYIANRHLSVAACARAMGRTEGAIEDYRKRHPEAQMPGHAKAVAARAEYAPPRDDVRKVIVPNVAGSSTQWGFMSISLPKEPWVRA
jgi:hypothetical protein